MPSHAPLPFPRPSWQTAGNRFGVEPRWREQGDELGSPPFELAALRKASTRNGTRAAKCTASPPCFAPWQPSAATGWWPTACVRPVDSSRGLDPPSCRSALWPPPGSTSPLPSQNLAVPTELSRTRLHPQTSRLWCPGAGYCAGGGGRLPPAWRARRPAGAGSSSDFPRQVAEEVDQAGEIGLLVVVHGHVATFRTVQVVASGEPARHLLHVCRVHRVVAGADDQGG